MGHMKRKCTYALVLKTSLNYQFIEIRTFISSYAFYGSSPQWVNCAYKCIEKKKTNSCTFLFHYFLHLVTEIIFSFPLLVSPFVFCDFYTLLFENSFFQFFLSFFFFFFSNEQTNEKKKKMGKTK